MPTTGKTSTTWRVSSRSPDQRLRRFLALSRSTHGLLDIAMPGFTALLWLGHFPAWRVLALALLAAVAGYTAVYALNDLVGFNSDQAKLANAELHPGYTVEASPLRYPLARKLLSLPSAIAWFAGWFCVALLAAWLLNPIIIVIAIAAAVLEAVYGLLLRVTYWRTLLSGLVKSAGPVAAVYVVVAEPALPLLGLMLAWLMCWEIGGQNIPADWNDTEVDRRVGAKTIPVVFGPRFAAGLVALCTSATVVLSLFLPQLSPLRLGWPYLAASGAAGVLLLLLPALRLAQTRHGRDAARLFDWASYYPLAQLLIITGFVLAEHGFGPA